MPATTRRLIRLLALSLFMYAVLAVPSLERSAWKRIAKPRASQQTNKSANSSSTTTCATPIVAPKKNVWNSLTDDETASVTQWLFDQRDLNLTKASEAGDWDNTLFVAPDTLENSYSFEAKLNIGY
jgi:primary-amine oxidase